MNNRLPWDITAADAGRGKVAAAAEAQVVRRLMVMLLLTATALDLTRCGLVMTAPRRSAPAAGLVAAGLAAAALTARTARGCRDGQRWAGWAALLIGAASAPQAAASGFRSPSTSPDTATAALGMLLAITILATAGRMHRRNTTPKIPACWTREPRGDPARGRTFPSPQSPGRYLFTSVEPMCETNTADAQPLHPPGEESVRSMNTGYVLNVLVDGPADTAWSRSHTQPALRRQRTMIDLSAGQQLAATLRTSCSITSCRHQPTDAEEGAHPRERRMPPLHPPLPIRRSRSRSVRAAPPAVVQASRRLTLVIFDVRPHTTR